MPSSERRPLASCESAKTVSLTDKDVKEAARLLRLLAGPGAAGEGFPEFFSSARSRSGVADRRSLIVKAQMELGARRARGRYFQRELFAEPAWDILLSLYTSEESGARLTSSKLAECIGAPLSTVVRWIKALEEKSLVGRLDHPTDRRIVFIRLLDKGRSALDAYYGATP